MEQTVEIPPYSKIQRAFETLAVFTYFVLAGFLVYQLVKLDPLSHPFDLIAVFFLSLLAADFASGLVHWGADTWGSVKTPILGKTLIRSFREHHVDPSLITHHDFVETNGATCFAVLSVVGVGLWTLTISQSRLAGFFASGCLFFSMWIVMTNQFHKWAHEVKSPKVVRYLQKTKIILTAKHHNTHHRGNYDRNYCITVGWLNPVLEKIRFFRIMEALITKLTGYAPNR